MAEKVQKSKKIILEIVKEKVENKFNKKIKNWKNYSMLPILVETIRIVQEDSDMAVVMLGIPQGLNAQTIFWKEKGVMGDLSVYNGNKPCYAL